MACLNACLKDSTLQGYLGEFGPGPLRPVVENHLAACARCRASFDRVVETNRRVNSWLAKLIPAEGVAVDATIALTHVLNRIGPNDHLSRLLAPDAEIPWYKSIYVNVRDLVRHEKLPPLELTSQPVAVKDIWGQGTNPGALASSVVFQGAIVAILMLAGATQVVRKLPTTTTLLAPPPEVKPVEHKSHAGGGGQHSPLPPLKAQLPKPTPKVFNLPLVAIEHPALVMNPSLIAPPDAWAAPTSAIGNPLGVLDGGGGLGNHGGPGNGDGPSIGTGTGVGDEAGIFTVGNGITKPEVISQVDPEYSEEARKAKYSGSVMLSIVVNTDGKATAIRVVKSLGMGLDEKAVEAVQKWRFKPGTNKGIPVRVKAQIEVNFRLL